MAKDVLDLMAELGTSAGQPRRRRRVWPARSGALPVATLLACVAAPWAVHAQIINQYLNTDIPGYGAGPGITVESRAHPEYEAQGVRLGSFVITPALSESVGYDDNVTGTQQAGGSPLIETDARVGATGGWSDTSVAGALTVDDYEYPERSNQSYTNWTAAVGGSHDFGNDTLSIGATHLNLSQTPRGLNVPGLGETSAYRVEDVRTTYQLNLGRTSLVPALDVSYYDFDNGRLSNGTTYLQDYRNRIVVQPSLIGSYEFATRRHLVLVLRDAQADFDTTPPGLPRQNFNDISALGGLAYDADGVIGFRLLIGYEQRSFTSSQYRKVQAPILEGSVTWTPTGLTTATATAARYIEDSASESTVGFTETALRARVDHEYLRNVILSAHAGFSIDDYEHALDGTGGGSQSYFSGGVGVSWKLNRTVWLSADYVYSTRHSDPGNAGPVNVFETGENFGNNYAENTVRLTVRLAL